MIDHESDIEDLKRYFFIERITNRIYQHILK